MRSPSPKSIKIKNTFNELWDYYGDDKSTEFLLSLTADREGVEYEDVVDALADCVDNA